MRFMSVIPNILLRIWLCYRKYDDDYCHCDCLKALEIINIFDRVLYCLFLTDSPVEFKISMFHGMDDV